MDLSPRWCLLVLVIFINLTCSIWAQQQFDQSRTFYCFRSNLWVPLEKQCDGYPDCPNYEDETHCPQQQNFMLAPRPPPPETLPPPSPSSSLSSSDESGPPSGYVKLPDELQQRVSFSPLGSSDYTYGQDYFSYPGGSGMSPCAKWGKPSGNEPCSLSWLGQVPRYFFDTSIGKCTSFMQSYCSASQTYENQFNSYEDCQTSCGDSSMYDDYDQGGNQEGTFQCKDGSQIRLSQVCDGRFNCFFGEDEEKCTASSPRPEIAELTIQNFNTYLANNPLLLVKFYSPLCRLCIEFRREYEQAYLESQSRGYGVIFAQVNIDKEIELKRLFRVHSLPKILLWNSQFSSGLPRQFYRGYGLRKEYLLMWLEINLYNQPIENMNWPPCRIGEFQCGDSLCLPEDKVCDSVMQCKDGSDEYMCVMPNPDECLTTATSTTTTTTTTTTRPDIQYPTTDGPDGENSGSCAFRCDDGTCQPMSNRCNGVFDCANGIDEANCGFCKRTQFTCRSDGMCLDYARRCDGYNDCYDGSDEELCNAVQCVENDFICSDGSCIDFSRRCDGNWDCPDQSDELSCPERCNSTYQFTCNNGFCINLQFVCDGVPDCHDSSDEQACDDGEDLDTDGGECDSSYEWTCSDGRQCIDVRRRCDGFPDCADLSDEDSELCQKAECNLEWQFHCEDKLRCIDKRRRCDGYYDCYDQSDEVDCLNVECDYWQMKCVSDGICVDIRRQCDGNMDCQDGSDEINCSNGPKEPDQISTARPIEQTTRSTTIRTTTTTTTTTTSSTSTTTATTTEGCPAICPAIYAPVCGSDNVTYSNECNLNRQACISGATISIVSEGECPRKEITECENYQWTCEEGSCINLNQQCDGFEDCPNGEDERFCENGGTFQCNDGSFITITARCDGFPDCTEGEDELLCEITEYENTEEGNQQNCDSATEFTCTDGSCISILDRCDGRIDCPNEEDEANCTIVIETNESENETISSYEDYWAGESLDEYDTINVSNNSGVTGSGGTDDSQRGDLGAGEEYTDEYGDFFLDGNFFDVYEDEEEELNF